jgi:hypothetical protein
MDGWAQTYPQTCVATICVGDALFPKKLSGQSRNARRGAADRGECRQAAAVGARLLKPWRSHFAKKVTARNFRKPKVRRVCSPRAFARTGISRFGF